MKKVILLLSALVGLMACNQNGLDPTAAQQDGKIRFVAGGPAITANVSTKAAPSVNTGTQVEAAGFAVNCVTDDEGDDVNVWNNAHFVYESTPAKYEADKWWPNSDAGYKFYAVFPHTYTMTFAASGPTISVTDANSDNDADADILCAFMSAPTYKTANTMSFEHIFARLNTVTVSMVSPYTISNMSIMITPKIGGTYNIKTGAGQTDGTGWSSPVSGVATNIATAAFSEGTSVTNNNIYLVPGTYTLTATWTATKDNYTQTFTGKNVDVSLVAGKTNNITASLTGDGTEIQFNVSVTAWSDNAVDVGTFPLVNLPRPVGRFTVNADGDQVGFAPGNLQCTITSGPDATGNNYTGTDWCFADHQWDYLGSTDSANSFTVGKKMDLFGWVGQSASYDTYGLCSTTSNNSYYYGTSDADGLKTDWGSIPEVIAQCGAGWYTLSKDEWVYLFNTRSASTVNGIPNARYTQARIRTDISSVYGIILFPDDYSAGTPSGVTWGSQAINKDTYWGTQCTAAGWASLEAAGCVFLPAAGYRNQNVNSDGIIGYYWHSSTDGANDAQLVNMSGNLVEEGSSRYRYFGCSVRLVKAVE